MTARRLFGNSWPPILVTLAGIISILHAKDVSLRDSATFGVYLLVVVALPGVFFWRLLLRHLHDEEDRRPTWFEDLSLGTIFGFGLQLPVYLVGVQLDHPRLFLALPVITAVLSTATRFGRRVWTMPTAKVDARLSWALAAVILYAVGWLARSVFTVHPLSLPPYKTPTVDETFHLALISELLHRFPPEIPFLLGTPLDYHWFVHAQLAADHWSTGLDPTILLRELMPVAMVAVTILGLAAAALRLSGRPIAAFIAPALLVAGAFSLMGPHYDAGLFTEPFLSRRYVSNPPLAYGFLMALPPIMLILEVLRPDRKASRLTWLALALALLALAGSKATFMPIFLAGAVVLLLTQLVFRHMLDRTVGLLVALLLGVTAFAQFVLLGGSSAGLRLDVFQTSTTALASQHIAKTPTAQVVMTVALLIGWLLYGAGAAGLVRAKLWRDRRTVWLTFTVVAGVVIALVFFRSGLSELWFQRSVAPLVVLASAWGLAALLPDPVPRRLGALLAGLAGVAGLAAYIIGRVGEEGNANVRLATYHQIIGTAVAPFLLVALYFAARLVLSRLGRARPGPAVLVAVLLGLSLTQVYAFASDTVTQQRVPVATPANLFAPGGVQAATWIAGHSDPGDVLATNAHCRKPDREACDDRNFWISAYTERRVVVEGWGYTQAAKGEYTDASRVVDVPPPDPERLQVNDAAFLHPSTDTVNKLVRAYDVKYLLVSKKYPGDLKRLSGLRKILKRSYANKNYAVYQVK